MDAAEHGKVVLGTIIGHQSRPALDLALSQLQPGHFTDTVQANLFQILERYLDQAGGVLSRAAIQDVMRAQQPGTAHMYLEYYDAVAVRRPTPDEFRWSVAQLRDLAADRMTGEAVTTAMEILRQGRKEGKVTLRGHEDARAWLAGRFSEIERDLHVADSPEGDMRSESAAMLEEYATRKGMRLYGTSSAVGTGLAGLDSVLGGGLERGELDLIAGWTSSGKTSFIVQLAWHAAVAQGKNVVIFTTETLRPQVRVKLIARHSRSEQFGLRDGLNSKDIKSGALTPAGEAAFAAVVQDFARVPGRAYLAQVPRGATISTIGSQLDRITRSWRADLVIIDYLQLLRADGNFRAQWEGSAATIKEAKELARSYRSGEGVPVVSPWQIGRKGHDEGRQRGYYVVGDLSETQEAANSADVVLSLMEPQDYTGGRSVSLRLSVLKNRDGEARFGRDSVLDLETDYATSLFEERAQAGSRALLAPDFPAGEDAFGGSL